MQEFVLDIPDVPPSLNGMGFGSRGAHMKFHRLKKQWEGYFTIALLEVKVPKKMAQVVATALCRFKDRRKRDEGNFRFMLEKALGDALQLNGVIADDTPDQFTFPKLEIEPDRGVPRTLVTLEVS